MFDQNILDLLKNAKHIAVLTGAGVSAESGIPTFRDALTGLWSQYSAEKLASENGFRKDPALVWGWYQWRRNKVLKAQPNAAHIALKELEAIVPKLTIITQNVDDLHERAGSSNVIHLHGSINKARCISCEYPYEYKDVMPSDNDDQLRIEPPKCEICDADVRPSVVWFGEQMPVHEWHDAEVAVKQCDLLLVVGTSGLVYPAAKLPRLAMSKGKSIIEVNKDHTDFNAHYHLYGLAGSILSQLLTAIKG